MKSLCFIVIFSGVTLLSSANARAQEINFGEYGSYGITLLELGSGGLDFGTLIAETGNKTIDLANAATISMKGVKYLDVIVQISADQFLKLTPACADPSCKIPLTLKAAYANRGHDNIGQARFINVTANQADILIPVLRREGMPPGPPPTPPHKEFNPADYHETAYLYLYGSINVGNVNSGTYNANVTVSIFYN